MWNDIQQLGQVNRHDVTIALGVLVVIVGLEKISKKAIDRLRSRTASERREDAWAGVVELSETNPKETMEAEIQARELWRKVEETVQDERDRQMLRLMLSGERATEAFAQTLGISHLTRIDQRREVKQHRDRLMKVLERLGARLKDDEEAY